MSDPVLLTPGPLTTALSTKESMLHDWGSRDGLFIALNRKVCDSLLDLAGVTGTHVCVPIQGSGTFAVEAMLGTLVPRDGRVLTLVNGAYGRRMVSICRTIGRAFTVYETPEEQIPSPEAVDDLLKADPSITHVAIVHCETTTGILNPLNAVAEVVRRQGRKLLVDAMSSFGALPVGSFDALAASSNKCLEGVPGLSIVLCRPEFLAATEGNAHSVCLDLHDQWKAMEANGQWRFTPPTHVIAALAHALDLLAEEGGIAARGARYRRNWRLLIDGMRAMGFETLLPDGLQAPIIVTFRMPTYPAFRFEAFHESLRAKGYVIYPGKLAGVDSFRIGCIGSIGEGEIQGVLSAINELCSGHLKNPRTGTKQ